MVSDINGGFQQIPSANTFRPGEQQQTRVAQENEAVTNPDVALNQGENLNVLQEQTQESLVTSAQENRPPNPNNISSSVNRGSQLDITV